MAKFIFVGKKPKFLNLVFIASASDIKKLPEDVQKAVTVENTGIRVDSIEYKNGELIPFGSFVAWEPESRCAHGYNLWCKSNAKDQLDDGILEEVNGNTVRHQSCLTKLRFLMAKFPKSSTSTTSSLIR